jgi:hypothetical protein
MHTYDCHDFASCQIPQHLNTKIVMVTSIQDPQFPGTAIRSLAGPNFSASFSGDGTQVDYLT